MGYTPSKCESYTHLYQWVLGQFNMIQCSPLSKRGHTVCYLISPAIVPDIVVQ